jgi:hypothetical protein
MRKFFLFGLFILNTISAHAEASNQFPSLDIGTTALHAINYAAIFRIEQKKFCETPPNEKAAMVCRKLAAVSDDFLEMAATPVFNRYVTTEQAKEIILYVSSDLAKAVHKKHLFCLEFECAPEFYSEAESDFALKFKESSAGAAALKFASDRSVAGYVVREAMKND